VLGQKEASTWYFGDRAGLSFNDGIPIPLLDGQIESIEGCASIASSDGNLLFYTNGETVWNRFHQIMPGGENIGGNSSSTQAALIIPQPNSDTIFYIFTPDAVQFYQGGGNGGGLKYSIVDMSSSNGLVTQQAIQLLPTASEKITAVIAGDQESIWVLTFRDDAFYAYAVTENGVDATPVISPTTYTTDDFNNIRGAMKVSPDGTQLAIAHTIFQPDLNGDILLYDFDSETGIVSNEILLSTDFAYYGVEFSSDSSKLYVSGKVLDDLPTSGINIFQFDLDSENIADSIFELVSYRSPILSDLGGSLQIAIDKKIYHSFPDGELSVINKPNEYQTQAGFDFQTIDLEGSRAEFGLPPFIQSFFESIFKFENVCLGDTTTFTLFDNENIVSVVWDFDDPASGSENISTAFDPTHVYNSIGSYVVSVTVEFDNRPPKTFIENVIIREAPVLNGALTLVQCEMAGDDEVNIFNLNEVIETYNTDTETFEVAFYRTMDNALNEESPIEPIGYQNEMTNEILYVRVFSDPSCYIIEPLELIVLPLMNEDVLTIPICGMNTGNSAQIETSEIFDTLTFLFLDTEIVLYGNEDNALLEVSPFTIDTFTVLDDDDDEPQLYYRIERDNECVAIGGLDFELLPEIGIDDQEFFLCSNGTTVLSITGNFDNYLWSTGETTSTISISETGTYSLILGDDEGCSDEVVFTVIESPSLIVNVVVKDFRTNNIIEIETTDEIQDIIYSIDGGIHYQSSSRFINVSPGLKNIIVSDVNRCVIEVESLIVRGAPQFFTPNDDGFNDFWQVDRPLDYPNMVISIYDRYGKSLHTMTTDSMGWDGTYKGKALPSSSYWYKIDYQGSSYNGYFALHR